MVAIAKPPVCPVDHQAIKRDDVTWSLLAYRGLQSAYDGRGTVLELRNCRCGTTLCRPVDGGDCGDADCDGCRATREHGVAWSRANCINAGEYVGDRGEP